MLVGHKTELTSRLRSGTSSRPAFPALHHRERPLSAIQDLSVPTRPMASSMADHLWVKRREIATRLLWRHAVQCAVHLPSTRLILSISRVALSSGPLVKHSPPRANHVVGGHLETGQPVFRV